jgi:hypothetical protein
MTKETTPPPPLPSDHSPYPVPPAAHGNEPDSPPSAEYAAPAAGAGLGPLGMTLIGGAVAAMGLAIALPFLRRRKKAQAKPARGSRRHAKPPKSES